MILTVDVSGGGGVVRLGGDLCRATEPAEGGWGTTPGGGAGEVRPLVYRCPV